jgi:hypothetical protein
MMISRSAATGNSPPWYFPEMNFSRYCFFEASTGGIAGGLAAV